MGFARWRLFDERAAGKAWEVDLGEGVLSPKRFLEHCAFTVVPTSKGLRSSRDGARPASASKS